MTMPATVRTSTAVHYGTPRIAAARAYVARMIAARDSIEVAFDAAIDGGPEYASERQLDWYESRITSLDHDIARLSRAIRHACQSSGEAVL